MSDAPDGPGAPALDRPRSPRRPIDRRINVEMYAWLFMRLSGLLLIVLVLGHLFITNVLDNGVQRVNFAFVAGRWSTPFWRFWDVTMLWLAEIHGTVGLRTVINDYARRATTRLLLKALLFASAVLMLALGTFVIVTFDPDLIGN